MEEERDRNSEIIAHLGALGLLSSLFRGVDHIRLSLGEALDNIMNTISNPREKYTTLSPTWIPIGNTIPLG